MSVSYGFGLRKLFYFVFIGVALLISSIDALAASLTPTIHSVSTFGSWSDPNSWVEGRAPNSDDIVSIQGSIALDASYTVQGLLVEQGGGLSSSFASITSLGDIENNGALQLANLSISGDLQNNGTWNVGNIYYSGSGTANISGSSLINSSITLDADIVLTNNVTFGNNINLNGHSITISTGESLTVSGAISGTGIFHGQNTTLNTYGDISTTNISGDYLYVNIYGSSTKVLQTSISAKNVTVQSGAVVTNTIFCYYGCAAVAINLNVTADKFIINTGATISMQHPYNDIITVYGAILNNGTIQGAWGNLSISGDLQNNGTWNVRTYISWNTYPGASSYNLVFSPGISEGIVTVGLSYDITDKIGGQYYWQVKPDNASSPYGLRCINMGCISGGGVPPVDTIPVPTNLTQQIQSPWQDVQTIQPGEKIGKYQSGSGVILSVSGDTSISSKLVVDVYGIGDTTPQEFSGGYSMDGNKTLTLPYLGAGSYSWRARIETASGGVSDWVDYGTNDSQEVDYVLYEGFEPYPYGYKFVNSGPADGILSGGIGGYDIIHGRYKIDGTKWEIFNSVFSLHDSFGGNEIKMFDAFESIGLNNKKPTIFYNGNCFGLSFSALLGYYQSQTLESEFPDFYNLLGESGTVWENIGAPIIGIGNRWNDYNATFKTILAYQLYQKSQLYEALMEKSKNEDSPIDILNRLRTNGNQPYLLTISGKTCYLCKNQNHAIVPYKVEGNRIYIWDNNVPFSEGNGELAYNQFIEIDEVDNTWSSPYYGGSTVGWDYFEELILVNIGDIYTLGENQNPIGFNGGDYAISLAGNSDVYLQDSEGRISGFSGGTIIEQIPGVKVVEDFNINITSYTGSSTWKQIYLPQKQDGLTIKVSGKTGEQYDLMVAGGDYYTKVAGVTTSTGQLDRYTISRESVEIDFDDTKTGTYSLLVDNFQDTLTGTVYLDNIKTSTGTEQYTINWTGVVSGVSSAVQYSIDENSDGISDLTFSLPAVYQDVTPPITNHTLSGELLSGTTSTYVESLILTLTSTDNLTNNSSTNTLPGVGVDAIYYALGTDTGSLIYLPYTAPIVVNGVGTYTLHYYAVDKFGNQEADKTTLFTLTERPETYAGNISGYIYDDANQNGARDPGEVGMAGWKVCIDTNNNNTCEESSEPFNLSNNDGYYEFDSLITGVYSIIEIPHQNWIVTQPTTIDTDITTNTNNTTTTIIAKRIINLSNGQRLENQDFGNYKTKGSKK